MKQKAETMNRNAPFDFARLLACCAVIILHVSAGYLYQYGSVPSYQWHFANAVDSAVRWCVPVFVLLSGALNVTSKNTHYSGFLTRRLTRLSLVIIFWSAAFFAYAGIFDANDMVTRLLAGQPYYHLYFLFLIGGLYLLTPAFASYTKAVGDRQAIITGLVCLIIAMAAWAITDRRMTAFTWFIPFIGYYLIGGPLSRNPLSLSIAVAGFVISYLVTVIGTWLLVEHFGPGAIGLYLYNYLSPSVIWMSICIFSIFVRLPVKSTSLLVSLSAVTLGVYVLHPMILETLQKWMPIVLPPMGAVKTITLLSVVTVVLTFALAFGAAHIPLLRKVFR